MDPLNARPQLLKQANLSSIRRLLRAKGTATRAEITRDTGISPTTVRALLAEMSDRGEVESAGHDDSSGGRKAGRCRFRADRFFGASLCITDREVHGLVVDGFGVIVESVRLEVPDGDGNAAVLAFLDGQFCRRDIRAVGLGVPGVVDGDVYWKKYSGDDTMHKMDLGQVIAGRYGVPVVLENDLKATALGFGRCYAREFPGSESAQADMAYLFFEDGCVTAGFLSGGRVIQGSGRFAGELSLAPMGGDMLLDDLLGAPMDDEAYTELMIQILGWICAILNPRYIALGGSDVREGCVGPIGDGLSALLPGHMAAELLRAGDRWHDYHDGMAALTAEKIFDDVLIVKE